jgi:hypothetical protein
MIETQQLKNVNATLILNRKEVNPEKGLLVMRTRIKTIQAQDTWLLKPLMDQRDGIKTIECCFSGVDLLASRDATIVSARAEVISTEETGLPLEVVSVRRWFVILRLGKERRAKSL